MNTYFNDKFITENRPKIKIEKIEFENYSTVQGEESPADEICFMTPEGNEAFMNGKETEAVDVTFYFKDEGADFAQKYIGFYGDAQLVLGDLDSPRDFYCDTVPDIVFPVVADEKGCFRVTVPLLLRRFEDDDAYLFDTEGKSLLFKFDDIRISNGFVEERTGTVFGETDEQGNCENAERADITYFRAKKAQSEEL